MALKNKFKKKEVEVVSSEVKETKKEQVKLELIKNNEEKFAGKNQVQSSSIDLEHLKNTTSNSGDDHLLERKLNCYHKINELYQSNSLSLFNLMKGVLEIISLGVEAKGGSLWIVEDNNTLTCKVAIGPGSEKVVGINLEMGQGVVGWVAENKKSQIVYDTSLDERFKNKKNVKDNDIKTMVSVPLLYNNEIIGVIQVVNKNESEKNKKTKYTDDDKLFLEDLSTLVAMHIKTKRALKNQDSMIRKMENFADLHEKFSSTIDLDELLVMVLKKAINLVDAEVGSIWLVEDTGEGVICSYAEGPTKDKVQGLKLKRGVGIIGEIIDSHKGNLLKIALRIKTFLKLWITKRILSHDQWWPRLLP
jgi:signal transduction protein with GAF and PtsI domain